jgi:hypothetical protein
MFIAIEAWNCPITAHVTAGVAIIKTFLGEVVINLKDLRIFFALKSNSSCIVLYLPSFLIMNKAFSAQNIKKK